MHKMCQNVWIFPLYKLLIEESTHLGIRVLTNDEEVSKYFGSKKSYKKN